MDIDGCFMYSDQVPARESVVMVLVYSVSQGNTASVALLQYGNRTGSLKFTDQQRPEIVTGRVISAVVTGSRSRLVWCFPYSRFGRQNPHPRRARITRITLSPNTSADSERRSHRLYTKQLHVKAVLSHLARALETRYNRGFTLNEVYKLTQWPRYGDVTSDYPGSAFWQGLQYPLKTLLLASSVRVTYSSLRIENSRILSSCALAQKGPFCSVVALIRQFEAFLKRCNMLPMDDSLSIQDFINQLPDGWELGVRNLSGVAALLEDLGAISSRDGPPLTFVKGASTRTPAMRVYRPIGNIEISHEDYSDLYEGMAQLWKDMFASDLDCYGPLAAGLVWYPSYEARTRLTHEVLRPTPEELQIYSNGHGHLHYSGHVMLATGSGKDETGTEYHEFQDSNGDVFNGDRGFLRLYAGNQENLVLDYVVIQQNNI